LHGCRWTRNGCPMAAAVAAGHARPWAHVPAHMDASLPIAPIKSPTGPWLFSTALPCNVGLYKKRVQKRLCCVAQTCAQGYLLLCKPQLPLAESSPTGWRSLPQLREFCTPTTVGCNVGRRNQAPRITPCTRTLAAQSCLYSQRSPNFHLHLTFFWAIGSIFGSFCGVILAALPQFYYAAAAPS
jgi:hypothetical protein